MANGIDPSAAKIAAKTASQGMAANSFEIIGREWHKTHVASKSEGHTQKTIDRLEKDVFPWLGKTPITDIEAPDILALLRQIEQRGANELAHTTKRVSGRCSAMPSPPDVLPETPSPICKAHCPCCGHAPRRHHRPCTCGSFLRACDGYTGNFATRCALRLSSLVMLRPGEIRKAEWAEIDFERSEWRIPASKMKMRDEHIIPLSKQALSLFSEIKPLTGQGKFIFPSVRK